MSRVLEALRRDFWPYLVAPPLLVAMIMGFDRGLPLAMAPHLLRDTAVFVVCVGLPVHVVHTRFGERLGLGHRLTLRTAPIHLAILAASVLVGTEVAFLALGPLHPSGSFPGEPHTPSRPTIWLIAFLGDALVTALFMRFDRYRARIDEVELREARALQRSLAAQVQALQARIQPHFLFNSLNTVAALIQEDPARAESAVERLSELYRYTLDASRKRFVSLDEELAAVEGFLALEALRYGDRLKSALHVDPAALGVPVPPLLLQPLVENAVLHGIAPRREGGRLEVSVARRGDTLHLRVEDDGPGPGGSERRGSGTALADLRRRLLLIYGPSASLVLGPAALGGFAVDLALPVEPPSRGAA